MPKNAANTAKVAAKVEDVMTEPVNKEPVKTEATAVAKANASGFYCYIGPSILRTIKHGNLFFG
ncbi:MAG: hypothetical protein J6N15_01455, partial [Ruminiclostridium sp.]|nr:hypothetical protein [Ruminiclostridium sp.]